MDLIIFFLVGAYHVYLGYKEERVDEIERETMLNPEFYEDDKAFSKYVNVLVGKEE